MKTGRLRRTNVANREYVRRRKKNLTEIRLGETADSAYLIVIDDKRVVNMRILHRVVDY